MKAEDIKDRLCQYLSEQMSRRHSEFVLPSVVLVRLDSQLEPSREELQAFVGKRDERIGANEIQAKTRAKEITGLPYFNQSNFHIQTLADYTGDELWENWKAYLNGFSAEVREDVLQNFGIRSTLAELNEYGRLYEFTRELSNIQSEIAGLSNREMGKLFDDLLQLFAEDTDDEAAEHFTPRDVVRLICELLIGTDREKVEGEGAIVNLYEPTFGTAGMIVEADRLIRSINPNVYRIEYAGHEKRGEIYARGLSNLLMRGIEPGEDLMHANCFDSERQPNNSKRPNYILANPPFGEEWPQEMVQSQTGPGGKFHVGTPAKDDGSMLFLLQMISQFRDPEHGGTRTAILFNASPLFAGQATPNSKNENNIRRWIIEKDYLEAIISLPEELFYKGGSNMYLWIVTNRKPEHRKNKIQLIDGSNYFEPMSGNRGDKRNEISDENIQDLKARHQSFQDSDESKIFDNDYFGYRRVRVERPLRQNFRTTERRVEELKDETRFQNRDEDQRERILITLRRMPEKKYMDIQAFRKDLKSTWDELYDETLYAKERDTITDALSEKDQEAEIVVDRQGRKQADTDLRDHEKVPLSKDLDEYFTDEIEPYVPDAWIDEDYMPIGYEIPFSREFFNYEPPRSPEDIEEEIRALEGEIEELVEEVLA